MGAITPSRSVPPDLDSKLLERRARRASRAWERLSAADPIARLECLKHGSRGSVFRTTLSGSSESVIAKTGPSKSIATEAFVLGNILPVHGVPGPRLIGTDASRSYGAWVFLEDLGDAIRQASSSDAWVAYARVLARVHSIPAHESGSDALPRRGRASAFGDVLTLADRFARAQREPSNDSQAIDGVTAALQRVIDVWDRIEGVIDEQPVTLTHGDLAQKHVRWTADGHAMFIDWADAAWDIPAVDLFGLAYIDGRAARAYADAIRPTHASFGRRISEIVRVGRILRGIRALGWTLERYEAGSKLGASARFSFYVDDIRLALVGQRP